MKNNKYKKAPAIHLRGKKGLVLSHKIADTVTALSAAVKRYVLALAKNRKSQFYADLVDQTNKQLITEKAKQNVPT